MTTDLSANHGVDITCHTNALVPDTADAGFPDALDFVAELGYTSIVLPPMDPSSTDTAALAAALAERGLSPITIAGGISPETDVRSEDADTRRRGADMLKSVVDLTAALGGNQMNGVPYGIFGHFGPTSEAEFVRSAQTVGEVANYAKERGVMMTFEVLNRYETSVVNTASRAMEFVAQSGSDNLFIHLDTFHMSIEEPDLLAAISTALPKLGYLELGQTARGMLSKGLVNNVEVVRHALASGYTGRIGIEAFSRAILPDFVSDMLAIWREPYTSGPELVTDAIEVIRQGIQSNGSK